MTLINAKREAATADVIRSLVAERARTFGVDPDDGDEDEMFYRARQRVTPSGCRCSYNEFDFQMHRLTEPLLDPWGAVHWWDVPLDPLCEYMVSIMDERAAQQLLDAVFGDDCDGNSQCDDGTQELNLVRGIAAEIEAIAAIPKVDIVHPGTDASLQEWPC